MIKEASHKVACDMRLIGRVVRYYAKTRSLARKEAVDSSPRAILSCE